MTSRIDVIAADAKAQVRAELQAERRAQATVVAELAKTKSQYDAASAEIAALRATVTTLEHDVARWKQEAITQGRALQTATEAAAERRAMAIQRVAKRFRTAR